MTSISNLSEAMRNAENAEYRERMAAMAAASSRDEHSAIDAVREEARQKQIEKIKARPTERLAAYLRGVDKMIDEAREELVAMEAEHALVLDEIATSCQNKINAKRDELESYLREVERCKKELAELEAYGQNEVEKAAKEFNRQRLAQETIIRAQEALRDSLNPPHEATKR